MITKNDPAGMGIAFTNALNQHTHHRCRLVTTKTKYNFNFEKDLHVPELDEDGFDEIMGLLKSADIIHFHILADENLELGPIKVKDHIKGKGIVHHHHGHPDFRAHPGKYREKYRRMKRKALVSTPDLLKLLPEATWQPNLVPIDDPLFLPENPPLNGAFTVGQSVTRRELKNTKELIEVIANMQNDFSAPKVYLDIIENTDYKECLKRKKRCDVIFDHMQGYYGVSSLESLSQGKPVIAGLDDWNLSYMVQFAGTQWVPWINCRTQKDLKTNIYSLFQDTAELQKHGRNSRKFMCRHWSDRKVAGELDRFYQSL